MYTIQNFQNFEVCAVVQKTSESGITSNERLLVIKAGILYYHSKVPPGFNSGNSEELRSISSLSNIPKCSIFTPYLKTIKIDSKNPQQLILTFHLKDLKSKEELAKRATMIEPYEKQKSTGKPDSKVVQWRVKFSSTQKCKQWSKYLQQLKQHYKKLQQQQNQMYQKFLEDFNVDKKKVNDARRSLAVSPVVSAISGGNRATHLGSDGLGSSALARIVEDDNDRNSESSSIKKDELRIKNQRKNQAVKDYLNRSLFEEDGDKEKDREIEKEKEREKERERQRQKEQERERQREEQLKRKQLQRKSKLQQLNSLEHQMKQRVPSKVQEVGNQRLRSYVEEVEPVKTKEQLEQERLKEEEQEAKRKKEELEEEERERWRIIEFTRKRERERVEREKREAEEEERARKEAEEREKRERERENQNQEHPEPHNNRYQEKDKESNPLVPQQPSQPFEMTENMLDSETEKSVQLKDSWKQHHGQSVPEIPREAVISFNPIKSIELPLGLHTEEKNPLKSSLKKEKGKSSRKKSACENIELPNFLSYVDYLQQLFKDKFEERIKKQTEFLKYTVKLREQAKDLFERIVKSFNFPTEQREFTIVNKSYVSDRVTIQFALCQTKTIALYQGERTLYDQSGFKTLQQKFSIYNQIQSNILQSLKKKQRVSIRVPFYVLLEYRGVMGLVMVNDFLVDSETVNLEEASSQLLSEAALVIPTYLTHHFKLARIFSSNKYIIEVDTVFVQENTEEEKYVLNLTKTIDVNRKERLPSFERTKQLLENKSEMQIEEMENLELLVYTYHVRSLYRSGQGELQGKDFFSLILSLNPQYSKLMGSSCPAKYPLKGLFCEYINQLCGVSIELGELSGKQELLAGNIEAVSYHSICRQYSFPHLQVFSLIDSFEQFADKDFGKDILRFWKIYSQNDEALEDVYMIYKIISLIKAGRNPQALSQIEMFVNSLRYSHPFKLKCYEFLLNHYYLKLDISKFSHYFLQAINYVEFTFGNHSILLLTLYCVLGQFLNQHGQSQQAFNFYSIVISKTSNARALTQMEIDRSSIYLNMTNKVTISEILSFTRSLLNKRDGVAKIKIIRFLAYLTNIAGKQSEAMDYIQEAIEYYETNNNTSELIECYMLGSGIWYNNITKLKQIIGKVYVISKGEGEYLPKLCELIKGLMMRLATRANIEISYLKSSVPKAKLFESISPRINGNIVEYIQQVFGRIQENESSEEISEFLQFAFN